MLADIGSVGFKVENFNRENMAVLEKRWPDVKRSLRLAVQLLASFGFNEKTLCAEVEVLALAADISALAPLAELRDPSQFQRLRHP